MFKQNMYTLTFDEYHHALKPMNCPCHVQIYNQGLTSYKELPIRFAEFGSCHRFEPSGALHGIMRLRNFVQDDGHIFCREDQIQSEVVAFIKLLYEVYADFGFTEIIVRLSTRPVARVGSDAVWDKAEQALMDALQNANLPYELQPGEGAFYGPKIEFSLKDCIGRVWQCGTIQVDFSMPGRLGASYIAEDGSKQVPVMLHRAVLGAFERFMGIVLEETAGSLPVWLAPVQVALLNITERQEAYLSNLHAELRKSGFRVIKDLRNEKIGFKIREHTMQRVPYLVVAGDKEVAAGEISVRTREGADLGVMPVAQFVKLLQDDIA
jgi:threonyl-tRNA synthetase